MSVPSFPFLALVIIGALIFNISKARWWHSAILLTINIFMIQSFAKDLRVLVPYAAFLALGYVGVLMRRRGLRWAAWLFPAGVLLTFVWLKRYLFIPHSLLLSSPYLTIGLSYVFFRVMHLVIDGWEDVPGGPRGLVSYINYTLNFTSLVSGPIQRYDDYSQHEAGSLPLRLADIGRAFERIVVGFFKVYIVSSLLQYFQHSQISLLNDNLSVLDNIERIAYIIAIYPVFLFFNFSGYTDFVIGCARLFKLELPENFDRPFLAVNFIDFWSRWHITLSQWLKNYVYSPLLLFMMRRAPAASIMPLLGVVAYFVTFFLVGAWHGQTSEFLFFGVLQGGGVAANKLYQEGMIRTLGRNGYERLGDAPLYKAICRGLTFTWFAFTLLWFWSSWSQMHTVVARISPVSLALVFMGIFVVATVVLTLLSLVAQATLLVKAGDEPIMRSRYARTVAVTTMVMVVLVANFVLSAPPPEIVYKAF